MPSTSPSTPKTHSPNLIPPPLQVSSYTILPLTFPRLPSYPPPTQPLAQHYIYLRPHAPTTPTPDDHRALFVANIPIDTTPLHLRHLFSTQLSGGRIERVAFGDVFSSRSRRNASAAGGSVSVGKSSSKSKKRKRGMNDAGNDITGDGTGKGNGILTKPTPTLPETYDRQIHHSGATATIIFVDGPSMQLAHRNARRAAKARTQIIWGQGLDGSEDSTPALGSKRYKHHHNLSFPSPTSLHHLINTYMSSYTAHEASTARLLSLSRLPDADGFVTVTRGTRTGPARVAEAEEKLQQLKEKEEKKKRGMGDFYRFQLRERRKEEAGELVRRFEADRRRVQEATRERGNKFKGS